MYGKKQPSPPPRAPPQKPAQTFTPKPPAPPPAAPKPPVGKPFNFSKFWKDNQQLFLLAAAGVVTVGAIYYAMKHLKNSKPKSPLAAQLAAVDSVGKRIEAKILAKHQADKIKSQERMAAATTKQVVEANELRRKESMKAIQGQMDVLAAVGKSIENKIQQGQKSKESEAAKRQEEMRKKQEESAKKAGSPSPVRETPARATLPTPSAPRDSFRSPDLPVSPIDVVAKIQRELTETFGRKPSRSVGVVTLPTGPVLDTYFTSKTHCPVVSFPLCAMEFLYKQDISIKLKLQAEDLCCCPSVRTATDFEARTIAALSKIHGAAHMQLLDAVPADEIVQNNIFQRFCQVIVKSRSSDDKVITVFTAVHARIGYSLTLIAPTTWYETSCADCFWNVVVNTTMVDWEERELIEEGGFFGYVGRISHPLYLAAQATFNLNAPLDWAAENPSARWGSSRGPAPLLVLRARDDREQVLRFFGAKPTPQDDEQYFDLSEYLVAEASFEGVLGNLHLYCLASKSVRPDTITYLARMLEGVTDKPYSPRYLGSNVQFDLPEGSRSEGGWLSSLMGSGEPAFYEWFIAEHRFPGDDMFVSLYIRADKNKPMAEVAIGQTLAISNTDVEKAFHTHIEFKDERMSKRDDIIVVSGPSRKIPDFHVYCAAMAVEDDVSQSGSLLRSLGSGSQSFDGPKPSAKRYITLRCIMATSTASQVIPYVERVMPSLLFFNGE